MGKEARQRLTAAVNVAEATGGVADEALVMASKAVALVGLIVEGLQRGETIDDLDEAAAASREAAIKLQGLRDTLAGLRARLATFGGK